MNSINEEKCRICGKVLKGSDRIKSHHLTKATYYDALNLKSGEHLACYKQGHIIAKDMAHFATEHLLCRTCEQRISVWEHERERLFSSDIRSNCRMEEEPWVEVAGYNQDYIKLACLADIFRCSEASSAPYAKVNLGLEHGEKIRQMLLEGTAGDKRDYPVILLRYNSEDKMTDGVGSVPMRGRWPDSINIYSVIAPRGWVWAIKVDRRPCEAMEKVSISSDDRTLKILNCGNFKHSIEYGRIARTILGY